jgi:hypothetical protein
VMGFTSIRPLNRSDSHAKKDFTTNREMKKSGLRKEFEQKHAKIAKKKC